MFVGIDVAKTEPVVAVHPSEARWTVTNDERGVRTLVDRLRETTPTLIVLERTLGGPTGLVAMMNSIGHPRPDRDDCVVNRYPINLCSRYTAVCTPARSRIASPKSIAHLLPTCRHMGQWADLGCPPNAQAHLRAPITSCGRSPHSEMRPSACSASLGVSRSTLSLYLIERTAVRILPFGPSVRGAPKDRHGCGTG